MKLGVLEAKNRLSELLDRAVKGEEVVITRRGAPYARLVPHDDALGAARSRAEVVEAIRSRRASYAKKPEQRMDWSQIKALRDEGRAGC